MTMKRREVVVEEDGDVVMEEEEKECIKSTYQPAYTEADKVNVQRLEDELAILSALQPRELLEAECSPFDPRFTKKFTHPQ